MRDDTKLARGGRESADGFKAVNPPVWRASTVLFDRVEAFDRRKDLRYDGFSYGTYGTPTTRALEEALAEIENGSRAVVVSSGMAAITLCFMTFVRPGEHVLVPDSIYKTTRSFCDQLLAEFGIGVTYYDPHVGAGIEALIGPKTRLIFLESPGSYTFEIQDVPAIAAVAARRGVITGIDNTWASPLFFKPLDHGVDVSIQAATKYVSGHSDIMLGYLAVKDESLFRRIKDTVGQFGNCVSPDDCYMALRGLRTMGVRLRQHEKTAKELVSWLSERPEVDRLLYPAWPEDPGHALWKRDFTGASGLFGVLLKPASAAAVAAMVEGMRFFGIGASWGGYESLMIPAYPKDYRTATAWHEEGPLLRIHAGLEDAEDLKEDIAEGLARLSAAGK
ncbi:cystathionine beta-lyase [Pelagibius sp. CAU 1746]|uniref:cystathionine beta-lyase n=1 Tax=Pelagibius sp. CAU 1746 TaxID=3140370 RepID=UPI00325B1818